MSELLMVLNYGLETVTPTGKWKIVVEDDTDYELFIQVKTFLFFTTWVSERRLFFRNVKEYINSCSKDDM